MLKNKYTNKWDLVNDIKKNQNYLINYEIEFCDTGFYMDLEIQNLYHFLIDNLKYYNLKTWNHFFNWFYSTSQEKYELINSSGGMYQEIFKINN